MQRFRIPLAGTTSRVSRLQRVSENFMPLTFSILAVHRQRAGRSGGGAVPGSRQSTE